MAFPGLDPAVSRLLASAPPPFTAAEERRLGEALVRARRRRDRRAVRRIESQFVQANLRLVVVLARRMRATPLEDAFQDGAIGLMKAAERFEPERGWRFCTYASWWIRQAISRAMGEVPFVRVPVFVREDRSKLGKARARLNAEGVEPSAANLARAARLSPRRVELAMAAHDVFGTDALDAFAADEATPLDRVLAAERETQARAMLSTLSGRERVILEGRFADEPQPLRTVGERVGLSRERVRQIERDSLATLRRTAEERAL